MAKKAKAKNEKVENIFGVLRKGDNRMLVITSPSKKTLKRYKKKGWEKVGLICNADGSPVGDFRKQVDSLIQTAKIADDVTTKAEAGANGTLD